MKKKVWVVSAEQEGEWLTQRQIGSLARRMDLSALRNAVPTHEGYGPATSPSPWLASCEKDEARGGPIF